MQIPDSETQKGAMNSIEAALVAEEASSLAGYRGPCHCCEGDGVHWGQEAGRI
jgi:hypothetical protein